MRLRTPFVKAYEGTISERGSVRPLSCILKKVLQARSELWNACCYSQPFCGSTHRIHVSTYIWMIFMVMYSKYTWILWGIDHGQHQNKFTKILSKHNHNLIHTFFVQIFSLPNSLPFEWVIMFSLSDIIQSIPHVTSLTFTSGVVLQGASVPWVTRTKIRTKVEITWSTLR